ncbi:MAG: type transport system ATP-binding protein [Gaiellaceae bacterium]|nr:type transport system ATP-binding protein [Gaiellaceae bacterium]
MTPGIVAEGVGVRFLFDRQSRRLSPTLARFRMRSTEMWGLRRVSCRLEPGEGVALLGLSGAGKTSLLRAFAGVYAPDEGRLEVRGRVATLLSLEAGLISSLTGRENALLLGILSGLSRAEARAALHAIRERTELGEAFERSVASYSQGMRARLSFAVSECSDPQILLLDEVHEALDHEFRDLVSGVAHELLDRGGIVVATGHDLPLLERLCGRALLLEDGGIRADGTFAEVQALYLGSQAPVP